MRSLLLGCCLLLPLLPAAADPAETTLTFLYVDANTGGSSGGHAALQLETEVYHFQAFPDGLFRLVHDSWSHFRHIYNDLENRTVHRVAVAVTPADYRRVKDRFNRLYLIQNAHLDRLAGLAADVQLLDSLRQGAPALALPGAGLFAPAGGPDPATARLRDLIGQHYGAAFLARAIADLDRQLRQFALDLPPTTAVMVSADVLPTAGQTAAQRYLALLQRREALMILAQARPLQPQALLDPRQYGLADADARLSDAEQRRLSAYQAQLAATVVRLAGASSSEQGLALLLATARYALWQRALAEQSLWLLDPFTAAAQVLSAATVTAKQPLLAALAAQARQQFLRIRQAVLAQETLDEASYNRLENSAARYYELQAGATAGRAVRLEYPWSLPTRPRLVTGPTLVLAPALLARQREYAARQQADYWQQVQAQYAFNLLSRNCATVLVESINSSFTDATDRRAALGGDLQPGEAGTFIPFRLFAVAQQRLRVKAVTLLPAYRQRQLERMYRNEVDGLVYLREFNTLSASAYPGNPADDAFLLFTDDVFWPRPLFGAVNLVYGLVQGSAGLLTWPVEGGQRLRQGVTGALFSLPELFFFNVRKGSYEFVATGDPVQ